MTDAAAETAALAAAFDARVAAVASDAEAARALQWEVLDAIYGRFGEDRAVTAPLSAAYGRTVEALEALLGPDAHVGDVDMDLFEVLHNVWKSEFGSRPGRMTRKAALDYLARHRVGGPEAMAA